MKVFVLAGSRANSIADCLKDKNIDVVGCVEELTEDLFLRTISVDKFVIVDSDFSITDNMQKFLRLLEYDFFTCKEIVFIGLTNRNTIDFFNVAINKRKENATWTTRVYSEDIIPLNLIYAYIFNLDKKDIQRDNIFQLVYREPKESKTYITEEEDVDEEEYINGKDTTGIDKYERIRRQIRNSKNVIVPDMKQPAEREVEVNTDEEFIEEVEEGEEKGTLHNTVVVTGERKSGTTMFISGLVSSLWKLGKSVLVVDLQENSSTMKTLNEYYQLNVLDLAECKGEYSKIVEYFHSEDNVISVVSLGNIPKDIAVYALHIIEKFYKDYDVVIADVPLYNKLYRDIFRDYNKVFLTSSLRKLDVECLAGLIDSLGLDKELTVIFNKVFTDLEDIPKYTPEEAYDVISENTDNDFCITYEFEMEGLSTTETMAVKFLQGVMKNVDNDKK